MNAGSIFLVFRTTLATTSLIIQIGVCVCQPETRRYGDAPVMSGEKEKLISRESGGHGATYSDPTTPTFWMKPHDAQGRVPNSEGSAAVIIPGVSLGLPTTAGMYVSVYSLANCRNTDVMYYTKRNDVISRSKRSTRLTWRSHSLSKTERVWST